MVCLVVQGVTCCCCDWVIGCGGVSKAELFGDSSYAFDGGGYTAVLYLFNLLRKCGLLLFDDFGGGLVPVSLVGGDSFGDGSSIMGMIADVSKLIG